MPVLRSQRPNNLARCTSQAACIVQANNVLTELMEHTRLLDSLKSSATLPGKFRTLPAIHSAINTQRKFQTLSSFGHDISKR